jgi:hypothetical protein
VEARGQAQNQPTPKGDGEDDRKKTLKILQLRQNIPNLNIEGV